MTLNLTMDELRRLYAALCYRCDPNDPLLLKLGNALAKEMRGSKS